MYPTFEEWVCYGEKKLTDLLIKMFKKFIFVQMYFHIIFSVVGIGTNLSKFDQI